jgi:hypothetical protein
MTDFLSRLAGRSMGLERVAEPVIPAMVFPVSQAEAPASVRESFGDFTEEVEASAAPPMPPLVLSNSREQRPDTLLPDDRRNTVERAAASLPAGTPEAADFRQEATPTQPPARAAILRGETEYATPAPPARDRTLSTDEAPRTARAANEPTRNRVAAERETPPVIRVTIGRVEVRAELPAPRAHRSAADQSKPAALSLDDYLKQRSEGRR